MRELRQKLTWILRGSTQIWFGRPASYLALGLAPWIIMAWSLLPRLVYAAADIRQLHLAPMGGDESWIAHEVEGALKQGKPLILHVYPDFYFLAAWAPLRVLQIVRSVTTTDVIVCLRLISLFCFLMVGVFSTIGIARLRGAQDGCLFSLLFFALCVTQEFTIRSTACQPDIMNLCVFTALFFCGMELVRRPAASIVALCGVVAGLGMAVKFSTVLVLPVLVLVLGLHASSLNDKSLSQTTGRMGQANRWLLSTIIVGLLLMSVLAFMASRRGSSLGWLPTPLGLSNVAGISVYLTGCSLILGLLAMGARRPLPQRRMSRGLLFFAQSGLLMALTFIISFYLGAPNQWFHLRFLREIGSLASVTATAGPVSSPLIKFHFWEVANPVFLVMSLAGGLIALVTWWRTRRTALATDEVLAIVWSATVLLYLLFRVALTRERYLYPAYPAMVYLAWISVRVGVDWFQRWPIFTRWARTLVVVVLLISQTEILVRERVYNCDNLVDLHQLNSYEMGRWLLANAPHDASILYSVGAYIPPEFSNIHGLGIGDPFGHLEHSRPMFVLLGDALKERSAKVKKDCFDEVFFVPVVRSFQFYSDLENGSLGFRRVCEFRNRQGSGFVVYKRDSAFPVELKIP